MTEQYWIERSDVDGERYVRLTDVIGFLMHVADQQPASAGLLHEIVTSLSTILARPDLEPRQ